MRALTLDEREDLRSLAIRHVRRAELFGCLDRFDRARAEYERSRAIFSMLLPG